jgi:hypothetical protein
VRILRAQPRPGGTDPEWNSHAGPGAQEAWPDDSDVRIIPTPAGPDSNGSEWGSQDGPGARQS